MTGSSLVAYAICRRCAGVFPASHRCPACDGDRAAAAALAAATACAVEPMQRVAARPPRRRLLASVIAVSAVMLGLGVGLGWLFAADAGRGPLTMSANAAADR